MSARLQVILAMQHDCQSIEQKRDEWERMVKAARTPSERSHAQFMLKVTDRALQSALKRKLRYMEDRSFATSTSATPLSASQPTGRRLSLAGSRVGMLLGLAREKDD